MCLIIQIWPAGHRGCLRFLFFMNVSALESRVIEMYEPAPLINGIRARVHQYFLGWAGDQDVQHGRPGPHLPGKAEHQ